MSDNLDIVLLEHEIKRIYNKFWLSHADRTRALRLLEKWKRLTGYVEPEI